MPATTQALLIAILVLSPGYIFTQVARRVVAYIEEPTEGRFFLTIITAGTVIHAFVFPWTVRLYRFYQANTLLDHFWEVFFWAGLTIFLLPLTLGILAGWLSTVRWIDRMLDAIGFGYIDRTPSAWDYAVKEKRGKYVRVHLKDGKGVVAGVYSVNSLGSINARRPDLYLEEEWLLDEDGNFAKPIARSSGVWIAHDIMGYVEFLEGEDEPYEAEDGQTETDDAEQERVESSEPAERHMDAQGQPHRRDPNDRRQGSPPV